jgi:DNA-binding response OmpR family regulator
MPTGCQVMLVEDNDELRDATASLLEQAGYAVLALPCAEDVDHQPTICSPDLYVIDLNLPGEDGLSLVARLRRSRPYAGIVLTTARARLDDRLSGYEHGADIYLPKPVDPPELLAVLRSLKQRQDAWKESGGGKFILRSHELLLTGPSGSCRLSDAEVRLLQALSSAQEQSLERWQVAQQLSPGERDISADNLQNRLSQLRKKLQHCGVQGESIKALRGQGYRLCVPLSIV